MRKTALVLCLLASQALALGGYRDFAQREFPRPCAGVPADLGEVLTFWARLGTGLTAAGAGDPTPTLTRATVATYVSPTGVLVKAISGQPRYEANGFLIERARTNALTDSEWLVNGWTSTALRTQTNVTNPLSPANETATGYAVCEDNSTAVHGKSISYTSTTGKNQTLTIYAQKSGRTILALSIGDGNGSWVRRFYNLGTGAVGTASVAGSASNYWESASSISLTNNWYRCVLTTGTITGTTQTASVLICSADGTISYAGDNSSSVFVYGVQAEDNAAFASSYIPTTTAAVTRQGESLSYKLAANFPNNNGSSVASYDATINLSGYLIVDNGNGSGPLIPSSSTSPRSLDGTNTLTLSNARSNVNSLRRDCTTWGASNMSLYASGKFNSGPFTGTMLPTASQITIGGVNDASNWMGHIDSLMIFGTKLSSTDAFFLTARSN